MKSYSFGTATSAIYDFFLYELCDYYLELLKPLMNGEALAASDAGGDVAVAQHLARTTLHVCLELGFRLLHPMMPFVTEELWQRLPGRGKPLRADGSKADWPSIMIADYPSQPLRGATRPDVEADFQLFQSIVRSGRSLRADAEISPAKFATFYITVRDEATKAVVEAQMQDMLNLLRSQSIKVVIEGGDGVEEGCSVAVVSEKCAVHLLLKGLIDPLAEVSKLEKKADKVQKEIDTFKKRMAVAGYADKVPVEVQKANDEALAAAVKQMDTMQALMTQYKSWAAAGAAAASKSE